MRDSAGGARPGREVLGQPGERAAQRGRDRQRAGGVGVDRAEHGPVGDVHRQPDRIGGAPVGHEAPEQLDVVVGNLEDALVERLLGGPDGGRRGAGEGAPEGAGSVERHESDCNAPARLGVRKRRGGVTHPMSLEAFHARVRTKGVNPIVYWLMRAWLQPFAHLYWRLSRIGREHVPADGPVIFVSNHRSFIDPFILGLCNRRPVYYVAKEELFKFNRRSAGSCARSAPSRSAAAPPTRT